MTSSFARLSLVASLLSACTVKLGDDPEGSSSSSSAADTDPTVGHSSAPTGDGPDATTDPPSTSNDSVVIPETTTGVEDHTTGDFTTGAFTTGDTDGGEPSVCAQMCEHSAQCGLSADAGACTIGCEDALADSPPACAAASTTMLQCYAGLSCEELANAFAGGSDHACGPEQNEQHAACGSDEGCDFGAGGDFDGTMCELEIFCTGHHPAQKMTCDSESCLCLEDGEQVGSCPSDAICGTLEQISDKGVSCCGFPPVGP